MSNVLKVENDVVDGTSNEGDLVASTMSEIDDEDGDEDDFATMLHLRLNCVS